MILSSLVVFFSVIHWRTLSLHNDSLLKKADRGSFMQCPKRVGSFGYSTDFLIRRSVRSDIRFCKKIMSLVYAKKSDEIGCVLRVCFACFYMRP